jgi:hypothetical protein
MRASRKTCWMRAAAFLMAGAFPFAATGCGGGNFQNKPSPAVPIELTGVIQKAKVTISPGEVGAGPILITISNQTNDAHTVILEGESRRSNRVEERVGPINPLDTATLQRALAPGSYEIRAGSRAAVPREIAPARLRVGRERADSNDEVLRP